MTDNELLNSFFNEAKQPIADDGFTERVMAALPARSSAINIRTLHTLLNVASVIASLALFIYIFTDSQFHILTNMPSTTTLFDAADGMLVRLLLFIRQLPELLPSVPQIVALVALLAILTIYSVREPVIRDVRLSARGRQAAGR